MKTKMILCAIALLGCFSCSRENSVMNDLVEESETVTLNFSPYVIEPITRSAISEFATHIDIWLVDGSNVTDVHQSSTDAGFGSISVELNRKKMYTLYAIAHKCASDATLSEGVISFPDDKITQSFFYTTSFTPATTTSLNCVMSRIVAQFTLSTTDAIPDEVAKFKFEIPQTFSKWNVAGYGTTPIDRVSTINLTSRKPDGSAAFNLFFITASDETTLDITVTALDGDDNVIESRTFDNVPMKNNYKTTLSGEFFVSIPTGFTLTASEWQTLDEIDF